MHDEEPAAPREAPDAAMDEHRRVEARLRDSEERYRALLQASSQVLYRLSPDWGELRQLQGGAFIPDTERPNRDWVQDYIPPDDQPCLLEAIGRAVRSGSIFELEHRVRRVDGSVGWVFSRAVPVRDAAGEIVEWFGAASDITARKQAEVRRQASEEKYRTLFANMTEGFALGEPILDARGRPIDYRFIEVNDAFYQQTGLPRGIEGRPVREYLPQLEQDWIDRYHAVALSGRPDRFESYDADVRRHYEVHAFRPSPGRFAILFRDITARKEAEAALLRSNEELQRFAHIASHDLQTPLRTIAGFARLVQEDYRGRLDARADDFLDRVVEGTRRMHGLIRDLLAYSRIDSLPHPFEPVELADVLGSVIASLHGPIRDAGATVTHGELPRVLGERSQLTQLLQNLVENALKYHGPEPARIHVRAERQRDEWRISVADNGIGIEPRHHDAVFEVFRRLHTQQAYPGTGIGLSVCRRVVERHGGRIWVESEPGRGSTFHFTLPAAGFGRDAG